MAKETRNFRMHPKLLMDVIKRQAGTLSKAILEGVMNAEDARAKKVSISLTEDSLVIEDDGEGFKSRDTIVKFFEVFGQPHDASEGKKFGTFRMGRGQLFAFGSNEWQTGTYRMHVDINEKGLDYDLETDAKKVPGCRIEIKLYEPIGLSGVADVRRDLELWCKWVYPCRVYFNGDMISNNPELGKWTDRTPEAFVNLKEKGSLVVYNLGVYVCEFPAHKFGTGGEVVSKQQLRVNFARNDIQSDCPVWRKVKPFIDQRASERVKDKKSLNDDERQRLADKLRRGEMEGDEASRQLRLFTAVTGRHFAADDLIDAHGYKAFSVAPKGDRTGELVMNRGLAFVFATQTLERFECTGVPELLEWVAKTFARDYETQWACKKPYKPFEELRKGLSDDYTILDENELTPKELLWLRLLEAKADLLCTEGRGCYSSWRGASARKLMIGLTDAAHGWTDASTYVAINRKWLLKREPDVAGITDVGMLLIHEACHHTPDLEEHDHDQEFFEEYHDMTHLCLSKFVSSALAYVPKVAEQTGQKLAKKQLKAIDKAAEAGRSAGKLERSVAARQGKS